MFTILLIFLSFLIQSQLIDGQFVMSHCYQTPATCANVANPCSQAPTCPIAPQALCYPNYCLGTACGVTQYFVSNPLYTAAQPVQGCPTLSSQNNGVNGGVIPLQPVHPNGGYIPGYHSGYPYQQPGYQQPGYHQPGYYPGYPGASGFPAQQPTQQQCSDLISKVLGPATGGYCYFVNSNFCVHFFPFDFFRMVTLGRKRRNADDDSDEIYFKPGLLFRSRRMLFDKSDDAGKSTVVRNPIRLIDPVPNYNSVPSTQPAAPVAIEASARAEDVCDENGCYVNIEVEAPEGELGDSGRGRWHQTHKMVRLVSCDPNTMAFNTNQCKYGQVCCQVYQVFNKHFCMGEPSQPWAQAAAGTNTQPAPPIFVSGKASQLSALSQLLFFSILLIINF